MFRKMGLVLVLASVIAVLLFGVTGQASAAGAEQAALSQDEIDGLVFMREEEKLARDVYLALYERWGVATFQNIAKSEQAHMDAVLNLLTLSGVADPVAGNDQGEFTNTDLQALYDQLVAQGSQSLADALKVGAAIEEIDIIDLRERAAQTDNAAILMVYANLDRGSQSHLRAFTGALTRQVGETYQPQYLSAGDYQAIVSGSNSRGNTNAAGNGNQGGQKGGRGGRR